jgi:hypothetical protein
MACNDNCKCDKEIRVSFCPKCKSRDVKYVFGLGNIFGVIPKMRCGGCGNEMASFPVLVTTKKLLADSSKDKKSKKRGAKK